MKRTGSKAIGMATFFIIVFIGMFGSGIAAAADDGTFTNYGLVFPKDATCLGRGTWDQAPGIAAGMQSGRCGVNDGSKPGDWRVPTLQELQKALYSNSLMNIPSLPNNTFWTNQDHTAQGAPDYGTAASPDLINGATQKKSIPALVLPVRNQK